MGLTSFCLESFRCESRKSGAKYMPVVVDMALNPGKKIQDTQAGRGHRIAEASRSTFNPKHRVAWRHNRILELYSDRTNLSLRDSRRLAVHGPRLSLLGHAC